MNRYQWIVDRARAGEPVPIDTTRRDMGKVWDNTNDLLWVVRSDAV